MKVGICAMAGVTTSKFERVSGGTHAQGQAGFTLSAEGRVRAATQELSVRKLQAGHGPCSCCVLAETHGLRLDGQRQLRAFCSVLSGYFVWLSGFSARLCCDDLRSSWLGWQLAL